MDKQLSYTETGKSPIGVRWVYVNKGDQGKPEIRARLVAQEIRQEASDGSMYAATPPLESVKWLLSLAASSPHASGSSKELKVSFVDASRAYFNSPCNENVFVELPSEDFSLGKCGRLLRWMYGTRKAASRWEDFYSSVLFKLGFIKGKASPCTFFHKAGNLR